jgi:hypothetical protein
MKHNFNHLIAGYWAGVYSQSERVDLEEAVFSAITPYMFVTYGDAKAEPRFVAVGSQVRSSIGAVVGSSILSLFGVSDRSLIRKLFLLSWEKNEPLCFTAKADLAQQRCCEIEISIFPIRQRDDQSNCYMGLFMPLQDNSDEFLPLPLKFMMSEEVSNVLSSEGGTIVPFRGKSA